jgi:hypothetical protein
MNKYVQAFKNEIYWFIKEKDVIKILSEGKFEVNDDFSKLFPKMNNLLKTSILTKLSINKGIYWLIYWENNDKITGWLCNPPEVNIERKISKAHSILLQTFGGIVEQLHIKESLISNMNSIFSLKAAENGIGAWKEYFNECCKDDNLKPTINLEDLIVTATEANGNLTLYNINTDEIVLFAPDHCFNYVTCYEQCPEYTFYKINGCNNFVDWVEEIANQWLI